jgi:hypothetical protein
MDRHNLKIRNKILIDADMFYSKAFIKLSASAIRTLMRCMQKRKWDKVKHRGKKQIIYSNDGFIFPYAEAKFLNIGTTQFWKNMRNLIDLGFIEVIYQGGWFQKSEKEKDYSVYKFSDRWKHYGTPDFEHIVKPKALPYGFTIQAHLKKKNLKVTSQKRSEHLHESEAEKAKQDDNRIHKSEVEGTHLKQRESLDNIIPTPGIHDEQANPDTASL